MPLGLNDYRDEAGAFLAAVGADQEDVSRIVALLDEELDLLRKAVGGGRRVGHRTYDVLFLLFELAARFGVDVDAEWEAGRTRKATKYMRGDSR